MYTVTFYSYKGGVGRTMALANVAVMLAEAGKRVLCVDFDLEAPGLPSYATFSEGASRAGVVDYVNAYRQSGIAPDVTDYIVKCASENNAIWLMPAGRHTETEYSEQLNAIDWQELYDHQSGFLMFEDLKQQWEGFEGLGFDYVLIDSRTGHTDVGGICTRQLPDAVVVFFLPNHQNISGLVPIVEAIKSEIRPHRRAIEITFCASNIPDLDDEKSILADLLSDACKRFKRSIDVQIHHYNSMELLDTKPFALSRRNSKLSKEIGELRTAIISRNFADRDGAIVALKAMPKAYEQARSARSDARRKEIRADTLAIRLAHENDGEIAYRSARVFDMLGDQVEELRALDIAINQGYEFNQALLERAHVYATLERRNDAKADLLALLENKGATVFEIVPALQLLKFIDDDDDTSWLFGVEKALTRDDDEFQTLANLHTYLMTFSETMPMLAERFLKSMHSQALSDDNREVARNTAALAFIRCREFAQARSVLQSRDGTPKVQATTLFNLAMAESGLQGSPAVQRFANVIEALPEAPPRSPNMHQCYGLTHAILGNTEAALKDLELAVSTANPGALMFSCWRYLYVQGVDFQRDCEAIAQRIKNGESLLPPFFHDQGKVDDNNASQ